MKKNGAVENFRNLGKQLLQLMKHVFFHNGGFKLLAVLISVILWAGLISQDESLTRDKTFQSVNVNVSGTDTMKRNGYIVVSDLDSLLNDVSVTAAVPQRQYDNAEASAYNLRVDLSRINSIGEQELKILSSNSSLYGRVTGTNPASIRVNVEEYTVRQRIPVTVSVTGTVPEGWYMSTPGVDPALITVAGPRSLVQTISRARAYLDADQLEWAEGACYTSAEIRLYNRTGDEIISPLLGMTSETLTIDSVLIDTTMLPTKTFDVREFIKTTGSVARGYEMTNLKVSPESITIAARGEVLEQLMDLPVDGSVNLKNLKESTVFQLKVQKPSDDAIISNETVTVSVEISAIEDQK